MCMTLLKTCEQLDAYINYIITGIEKVMTKKLLCKNNR